MSLVGWLIVAGPSRFDSPSVCVCVLCGNFLSSMVLLSEELLASMAGRLDWHSKGFGPEPSPLSLARPVLATIALNWLMIIQFSVIVARECPVTLSARAV